MTDPVAVAALVVSAGSAAFTVVQWRRQNRLLEQQVQGETEDRLAQRRAELHVTKGSASGTHGFVEHEFFVVNAGPANARDVVYRVLGPGGEDLVEWQRRPVLTTTEQARVSERVPRPAPALELAFLVSWSDGDGAKEARLPFRAEP